VTRSGGNTRDRYHRNTWRVTKRVLPVTSLLEALLHLTGAAVEHNQTAAQRPGGDVSAVRTAMGMRNLGQSGDGMWKGRKQGIGGGVFSSRAMAVQRVDDGKSPT